MPSFQPPPFFKGLFFVELLFFVTLKSPILRMPSGGLVSGSCRLLVLRDIGWVDSTLVRVRVPLRGHVLSSWRSKNRAETSVVF